MESLRKESADLVIQWMNASRENFPPSVNRQREAFQCFSSGAILLGLSVGGSGVVEKWVAGSLNRKSSGWPAMIRHRRTL